MYSTKFNETSFDQLSSVADMRTSVGRFQSAVAKLVCRYRVDGRQISIVLPPEDHVPASQNRETTLMNVRLRVV
jgi:hypothetical protein